jgi:hypothetical protein
MTQELEPQQTEPGQPRVSTPTLSDSELSDEQLDQVAGGASHTGGANLEMMDGSVR